MAQLCIYLDRQLVESVPLGQRGLVLGRGRRCSVQLPDERVSRVHAEIRPALGDDGHPLEEDGQVVWELADHSLNGTRLNGVRIDGATELQLGDRVEIEDYVIVVRAEEEPALPRLGHRRRPETRAERA